MALHPILPVIDGESLTSYLSRAAHLHARAHVYAFLDMIEFPRSAAMAPDTGALCRLSGLLGLPHETLTRMTFVPLGNRARSLCGEVVHAEFAKLDKTSFCPACLLADGCQNSPSGGARVGRVLWQVEHVRACPVHGSALYRRQNMSYAERFQLMSQVAPEDAELHALVDAAVSLPPSDLQTYVEVRLAGRAGPAWLDEQPLDLAARACEMLGVIITEGAHCNLNTLPEAAWHRAGHVGFGFAAHGETGIREALQSLFDLFVDDGLKGGPQKVFGRLYQWLQFNKNARPKGPIRDVVREFVMDRFPVEVGDDLFGEPVEVRRVHTVGSLARVTGQHPKTLNRAVVLTGLADGDPDVSLGVRSFDAAAGEALARRIETAIPVLALPKFLNCNRTQAEQLVRTGMIPRISGLDEATGALKGVALEHAESFLTNLMSKATQVAAPSDGMQDILTASITSRWPVIDIVGVLLSGGLSRVEVVDPALKFKGVLVDPAEVATAMANQTASGLISLERAVEVIGLSPLAAVAVLNMTAPDEDDYIPKHVVTNAKGVGVRMFRESEVQSFRDTHVGLVELAASHGMTPKSMKAILSEKGIQPLPARQAAVPNIYRRSDLSA
ncbi:MAG: TniQ family protein [Loktanella sp.]|nr:TniQ family protein [Loktanella sp.]